ncbi:DUF3703 domain-containing protein [Roseivirga sp. BDSF3-8]|uniref:DUF3703 domain-containing protein n=1 Tax=Roseivirga sp. BDSF3-8 TaxID=3241598 RepID=UPI003531F1D6
MKVYTKIPDTLRPYFDKEINAYRQAMQAGDLHQAWRHLERAHVIGQAYPYQHSYAHWKMLQFGFRIKSVREIIGQIPRLLVGGVKSFVGKIPVGNTGGANILPLKPLPIEADIKEMFRAAGVAGR